MGPRRYPLSWRRWRERQTVLLQGWLHEILRNAMGARRATQLGVRQGGRHFVSPFVRAFSQRNRKRRKEFGRRVDAKRAHFVSPSPEPKGDLCVAQHERVFHVAA